MIQRIWGNWTESLNNNIICRYKNKSWRAHIFNIYHIPHAIWDGLIVGNDDKREYIAIRYFYECDENTFNTIATIPLVLTSGQMWMGNWKHFKLFFLLKFTKKKTFYVSTTLTNLNTPKFPFQLMGKLKLHSRLFALVFDLLKTFHKIRNKCHFNTGRIDRDFTRWAASRVENCSKKKVQIRWFKQKHKTHTGIKSTKTENFHNFKQTFAICAK